MKLKHTYLSLISLIIFTACSTSNNAIDSIDEKILSRNYTPIIYDSYPSEYFENKTDSRELLESFPFISLSHHIDFKGKFDDIFYDKIPYRYKTAFLADVNFFKLLHNSFIYDIIYIQPIWLENFKHISTDMFENICYSYNMSATERKILKWWIKQGGILWVEAGVFATGYENFITDVKKSDKEILDKLQNKAANMNFLGFPLQYSHYRAKKVNLIKIEAQTIIFENLITTEKFKPINTLSLKIKNFAENYFVITGEDFIKDTNGHILASSTHYGKGKIISILPLEFTTRYYDGELLRWKLLFYSLDK